MNEFGAKILSVETVFGRKLVKVPLCAIQIPQGMARNSTRVYAI
jgi:hypothetical protein